MAVMEAVGQFNSLVLWGAPMAALLIGTAIYLTAVTRGAVFTHFLTVMKYTLGALLRPKKRAGNGAITPFQAVCTALAATVGTGNIVGVALAVATGGPGAIFWLWISALIGMVLKFSEVTLSVAYRTKNAQGRPMGGPMHYIERGTGQPLAAKLFALFGLLASGGIGAAVQSNSLSGSLATSFGLDKRAVGIAVALLAGLVLIGGIRRISSVAEVLVPFMAAFYIIGALAVLAVNAKAVPDALAAIFRSAFSGSAAVGGFAGAGVMYTCRIGMARGLFTHEAGMGSAPIAHASADTDHPARQGLWGAFEVFFDSIVMCTLTGLVIVTSGLWCQKPQQSADAMSAAAFEQAFSGGGYIVSIGLVLFAFATIIAWYYYGERCAEYLFGRGFAITLYRILYVAAVYLGAVAAIDAVWELADLCNGLMALPNLLALILLAPAVGRLSRDFFATPDRIRPPDTDFSRLLIMRTKR